MNCQLCHAPLTDKTSVSRGIGPDCAIKYQSYLATCDTSAAELGELILTGNPTVQRWVKLFTAACADSRADHAGRFLNAARAAYVEGV